MAQCIVQKIQSALFQWWSLWKARLLNQELIVEDQQNREQENIVWVVTLLRFLYIRKRVHLRALRKHSNWPKATGQELSMTSTNSSPRGLVSIYFLVCCCCLLFHKCKNSSTGNLTYVSCVCFFPTMEALCIPHKNVADTKENQ